ncbi:MAG: ABC transporter transmembrane domain-containing protein [Pseudomonadota bacterium]
MTEPVRLSLRPFVPTLALIALFSTFVNLLMLTGPLFMLQVYDRVLSSRSEATLLVLFLLVIGLYGAMGLLDFVRSRIGARIGARLQEELDEPVFKTMLRAPASVARQAVTGLSDIEAVRRFFGAPVAFALFDLPFTPLFVAAIFIFHPLLGWLALAGGGVLVMLSLINQFVSRKPSALAGQTASVSTRTAEQIRTQPDTVRALGMTDAAITRWRDTRDRSLTAEVALSDRNGGFGSVTKALRLFLQSAMLALGAWLVLQDQLTAGAMIAASILLGRALAPIEQLIGGWSMIARARSGWVSLKTLLAATPLKDPETRLNRPEARLDVKGLTIIPPSGGKPIIQQVTFSVLPG